MADILNYLKKRLVPAIHVGYVSIGQYRDDQSQFFFHGAQPLLSSSLWLTSTYLRCGLILVEIHSLF